MEDTKRRERERECEKGQVQCQQPAERNETRETAYIHELIGIKADATVPAIQVGQEVNVSVHICHADESSSSLLFDAIPVMCVCVCEREKFEESPVVGGASDMHEKGVWRRTGDTNRRNSWPKFQNRSHTRIGGGSVY